MRSTLVVGIATLATLGGCVTAQDALDPYLGQDIQSVVARIGYPTQEREILGQTLYVWSRSIQWPTYNYTPPTTTTATTTGTVGGQAVNLQTTQTTPSTQTGTTYETLWCNIEVSVDAARRITSWRVFDSNLLACDGYFSALR